MHFQRFLRSRKAEGAEKEVPITAYFTAISGFLVLLIAFMMAQSGRPLIAAEVGEQTIASFKDFVPALESVVNGSEEYVIVPHMSLKDDQVFAVFGAALTPLQDTCQTNDKFKKPQSGPNSCGASVCACICNEDDACENPYECVQIANAMFSRVVAAADFDANLGKQFGSFADPLIYGDCDGAGGAPFGVRDLLIKKDQSGVVVISDHTCFNNKGVCYTRECPSGLNTVEGEIYTCDKNDQVCCKA